MKNLTIVAVLFCVSCTKVKQEELIPVMPMQGKPEVCKFGLTQFNTTKRAFIQQTGFVEKGPGGGGSASSNGVILLDMDGHTVSNTSWNVNGNIVCSPANLQATDIAIILQRVTNDFSPFNITVTTNETVYNNAPIAKRMRVVVTESWEWYGQAGGTSFIGSFTWGDNTPCFVFSSLLNYNIKNIAEACSHEPGHTFGLHHQATYDAGCVRTSEYNYGQGSGEIGWAPIMGVGYYQNLTTWHNGSNPYGCSAVQNDVGIISGIVGLKTDDYTNTITNAPTLSTSLNGVINHSTDKDFFKISLTASKTISLKPSATGPDNAGGNVDLTLNVYNSQGVLLTTINNASALHASTILNAGTYYASASTESNSFAGTYGMLGNYTIALN